MDTIIILISLVAIAIYRFKLSNSLNSTLQLTEDLVRKRLMEIESQKQGLESQESMKPTISNNFILGDEKKISVIIPAYNEADNIAECLKSVLKSTTLTEKQLEVWIVDDVSDDYTLAIAKSVKEELLDPRLKILAGKPRRVDEVWVGKNWACTQAVKEAEGDFLLFLDADVRLKPLAIETALIYAQIENIDLLSLCPGIICGCLAEWSVQPLMINTISISFDFEKVNDPHSDIAFGAGPFMLYKRSAYEKIGGHQAFAHQVVEDVEMAKAIKSAGLKLRLLLGKEWVSVRMYRSWGSLWEGWTKNLYLASNRQLLPMVSLSALMLLVYVLPWLCLFKSFIDLFLGHYSPSVYINLSLSLIAIASHYYLRVLGGKKSDMATDYWWLNGLGGAVIALMAFASVIKTETGWGWTWRGRNLKSKFTIS